MNTKLYYDYCSKVLNGEIIAGETIKLACKRFQNDLKGMIWNLKRIR